MGALVTVVIITIIVANIIVSRCLLIKQSGGGRELNKKEVIQVPPR